jgi:hypothetical protein
MIYPSLAEITGRDPGSRRHSVFLMGSVHGFSLIFQNCHLFGPRGKSTRRIDQIHSRCVDWKLSDAQ